MPTPSLCLFLLLPQLQLWNCRCHFLPTVQRLRLRLRLCLRPRPRTICGCHSRISNTKDLSLSTFLRFSCFFCFSLLWFGRGSMFVPQFVACCHSWWIIGCAHLQPDCSAAARPSPRVRIRQLYCAVANDANEANEHKERSETVQWFGSFTPETRLVCSMRGPWQARKYILKALDKNARDVLNALGYGEIGRQY